MPSARRVRTLTVCVAIIVVLILYYSGDARHHRDAEFYQRTVNALNAAKAREAKDAEVQSLLKDAHEESVDGEKDVPQVATDKKIPAKDEVPTLKQPVEVGKERKYQVSGNGEEEKGVAGRKTMKIEKAGSRSETVLADEEPARGSTKDLEVEAELNAILKRSPIIIFSKSYCPYSRRAKTLLLDTYSISPAPFVMELDLLDSDTKLSDEPRKFAHPDDEEANLPLGKRLQNLLAKNTGRNTVPNILINGKSIGGSDEIAQMDQNGELASTIKTLGGKRIVKVEKQDIGPGSQRGND